MSQQFGRMVVALREGMRGLIVLVVLLILALSLFVDAEPGSSVVQGGLLAVLGFTVRDYFAFRAQQDAERADEPSIG